MVNYIVYIIGLEFVKNRHGNASISNCCQYGYCPEGAVSAAYGNFISFFLYRLLQIEGEFLLFFLLRLYIEKFPRCSLSGRLNPNC